MKKLAKSERLAVHISNATNLVLFVAKVYASMESRSMAVIASTLDSLLDLLSGFILWFTANAMRKPNHYSLSYWQTTYATCGMLVCPVALYLVSVYQVMIVFTCPSQENIHTFYPN